MAEPFSTQNEQAPGKKLGELYQEHMLLGAAFDEQRRPLRYANENEQAGAYVADLTSAQLLLFAGTPAANFAHTAFAGTELTPGHCSYQAVLTGDGSVADIPLLARTGTSEYLVLSDSPRQEVLCAWLSFLAEVSQDGVAPFADMHTQDVTGSHVLLLVWGPQARSILADYTPSSALPREGEVKSCKLDAIPCIVVGLPKAQAQGKATGEMRYLLFVPPQRARALWRSLLSFAEMSPRGWQGTSEELERCYPWRARLAESDVLQLGAQDLQAQGLLRSGQDFVGARGLFAR
ncbi:MAG: hypothetical protein Q4B54_00880 [Coriobacteriales bacterium]|nr:hypothetical protein [Coriobacteriales bacterium]